MKIIEKITYTISLLGVAAVVLLLLSAPAFNALAYYKMLLVSIIAAFVAPMYAIIDFKLEELAKDHERKENLNDKNKQL